MRRKFMSKGPLGVAIASALLVSSAAHSSGFALLEQSTSRLGTAFSGTAAAADDATTIFFNPAGLTHLTKPEAMVLLSAIDINSEFHDRGSQPALGQPLGGNGGNAGGWNYVPVAYASMPIGDRMAVGIGFNVPFGLKTEYDNGWIGRFQALKSEIKTINIQPSFAFRFNKFVSLGVGVDWQRLQAELTNSVNFTAVVAQALQTGVAAGQLSPAAATAILSGNSGLEGHASVRGDDHAWGYNVGLMFDITDATRVGVHYRSRLEYTVEGTASFTAPTATSPTGAAIIAAATGPNGPLANGPVSVKLDVPDSLIFSLRQGFGDKFELLADAAWTGWSSVQELRVVRESGAVLQVTPERWHDTWRYAIGGTYAHTPDLKFRAGFAFDHTPVRDSTRTPRLPDPNRKWLAIGVQWRPSEMITTDFGYAHLFSDEVSLDQNEGNTAANGLVLGKQSSHINILSAQVSFRF